MHFSQIAGSRGGDFAELRAYLVSKLMWNPEANVDSLMQHFLHGYYGEAAPYLYQYIKVMGEYKYSRLSNVYYPMDKNFHELQMRLMVSF